jgi:hypothetical protein
MIDLSFNLSGVQATTHSVAPRLIAHGPSSVKALRRAADRPAQHRAPQ